MAAKGDRRAREAGVSLPPPQPGCTPGSPVRSWVVEEFPSYLILYRAVGARLGVGGCFTATLPGGMVMSIMAKNGYAWYGTPMNVSLTPELEEFIRRKVASGLYKNAAEVVREGLRLLAEEDEWKAEVRRKTAAGMAQLRAGQVVDGEEAIDEVVQGLRRRRGKAKGA